MSDAKKTEKTPAIDDDAAKTAELAEGDESEGDESEGDESEGDESEGDESEGDESEGDESESKAAPAAAPASAVAKKKLADEDLELSDDPELAREERALAERRSKLKKKGVGKAALAKAASKKLAEVRDKRKTAAIAVDAADPLLARTNQIGGWLQSNQRVVQVGGALVAAALLGTGGYLYYQQKHESDASVVLSSAITDERGLIGEAPEGDDENRLKDPRPYFKTAENRRDSALKKYKDVQQRFAGTGAAYLARLGEASVLLDKRDADGAIAAYTEARDTPLAKADLEVRGRATEGLGFAHELKAQLDPAQKDKHLDAAMAEYKTLENGVDAKGFKELGMYHQARVFQAKGDTAKAKELLSTLRERITKPGENHPFAYLEEMTNDRLRMIDPKAVPPKPKYNEAQLQQMLQKLRAGGGAPGAGGGDDE